MIFDDTKFDLLKPNHVENVIKPKVLLVYVCSIDGVVALNIFRHRVGMSAYQLRSLWRGIVGGVSVWWPRQDVDRIYKALSFFAAMQSDNLTQITIRYASSAFLSLFVSRSEYTCLTMSINLTN